MATTTFTGGGGYTDSLTIEGDLASVAILACEMRLRSAFPTKALEEFRKRVMVASSTSLTLAEQSRSVLVNAHRSELKSLFDDLLTERTFNPRLSYRRRLPEADAQLTILTPLHAKVFQELTALGVPLAYNELLKHHLTSTLFSNRVSAACAIVLLASILILEREA